MAYEIYPFIINRFRPKNMLQTYGKNSYVLVTGGSYGIGLEYAKQFASFGFNIILVARTISKLEEAKKDLKARYPRIDVRILVKDFTKSLENGFFQDFNELRDGLDISIVINNVGVGGYKLSNEGLFSKLDLKSIYDTIAVNTTSQVALHRIFSSTMEKRGSKSAFIDLSSGMKWIYLPIGNVYSSTKDFNNYITVSLGTRNTKGKIDYLSHVCGATETPAFQTIVKDNTLKSTAISTNLVVSKALKCLGTVLSTQGHYSHIFGGLFMELMGEDLPEVTFAFFKIFMKVVNWQT